MFRLDKAIERASAPLASLPLSEARLMNDARFAWIVLAPRGEALVELEDLGEAQRTALLEEIIVAGRAVRAVGEALGRRPEKLNVGQLGNVTRQLHVHVVGRRTDDACWPGPVWGQGEAAAYEPHALAIATAAALNALGVPSPLAGEGGREAAG
jgi:diadenosine tetraphosphate (Ap4A) HIT family hydrolase